MSKKSTKKSKNKEELKEVLEEELKEESEQVIEEQSKEEILEDKVKNLEAEIQELKSDFLRKNADLENYKKRLIRDKKDAVAFANTSLIKDLLPTLDSLDLAINSSKTNKDFDAFVSGLELVQKHLLETLDQKWGLKKMDCEGKEFDPQLHEACLMESDSSLEHETVTMNLQTGYLLHERVLRPAKVKVAKPE